MSFPYQLFQEKLDKNELVQLILKIIIFYYKLSVFRHRIVSAFCHVKCIKHANNALNNIKRTLNEQTKLSSDFSNHR